MDHSRRRFCVQAAALALAGGAAARRTRAFIRERSASAGDEFFEWAEHGRCLIAEPPVGKGLSRSVAVVGEPTGNEGVLLVDASISGLGWQLKREVEARAKARVTHVINTCGLDGVTGGNHAFRGDAEVICHPASSALIAKQTGRYIAQVKESIVALKGRPAEELPELRADLARLHKEFSSITSDRFMPTREVGEATDLDWPGTTVRVIPVGPACTAGDLIVHVVKENVLVVGSLAWPGVHPVIERSHGASVTGWQAALARAVDLCDEKTVVIPSAGAWRHNPEPEEPARRQDDRLAAPRSGSPVGVAMLRAQAEYFTKLRRIVVYAKDVESMPRKDVVALTTGAFDGLGEAPRLKRNLGAMFDELAEERPEGK